MALKCDACRRPARYGATIPREKRGPHDPTRAAVEARFVLCGVHAKNVAACLNTLVWRLPGAKE